MELAELSKLVDEYDKARNIRLKADKEAKAFKKTEDGLAGRLIEEMRSQDVGFAASLTRRVKLHTKDKPVADDWPLVWAYMQAFDAMDLVQKRLHEGAVQERLDDDKTIPGLVFVKVDSISIGNV